RPSEFRQSSPLGSVSYRERSDAINQPHRRQALDSVSPCGVTPLQISNDGAAMKGWRRRASLTTLRQKEPISMSTAPAETTPASPAQTEPETEGNPVALTS